MAVNFSGKWHNQHCSEMDVTISTSGAVTGTYSTGVGLPTPAEHFDLVGFVSDDQIAFVVNFGRYGSLTAWCGQLTAGGDGSEFIETLWHLTENIPDPDEPTKLWSSMKTGRDMFKRGGVPDGCRPQVSRAPSHVLMERKP